MQYRANCYPAGKSAAGHTTEFVAEMTAHENPWAVGSERRYDLRGTMVAGIPESADVPGASADEMAAIISDLRLLENDGREDA